MHTVELMEHAMLVAESLGYHIRQEWLGGIGGGACEFAGKKWIFVDLSLSVSEQLDQLIEPLRADPRVYQLRLAPGLTRLLGLRKSA